MGRVSVPAPCFSTSGIIESFCWRVQHVLAQTFLKSWILLLTTLN